MSQPSASRLLVIDDDGAARASLGRQLDSAGYEVHEAGDGVSGLEVTRSLRPDVVLCDRTLPGLDGMGYCRAVRTDPELRTTYVAMITGRADVRDKVAGLDAGADEFLIKPVCNEELLARVRTGVRMRQVQRELTAAQHDAAVLELATTLGHEINNPLTALFGHMELMLQYLEQGNPGQMKHHVRQAGEVAGRIAEVAQSLLTLRRPRSKPYLGDMTMLDLDSNP